MATRSTTFIGRQSAASGRGALQIFSTYSNVNTSTLTHSHTPSQNLPSELTELTVSAQYVAEERRISEKRTAETAHAAHEEDGSVSSRWRECLLPWKPGEAQLLEEGPPMEWSQECSRQATSRGSHSLTSPWFVCQNGALSISAGRTPADWAYLNAGFGARKARVRMRSVSSSAGLSTTSGIWKEVEGRLCVNRPDVARLRVASRPRPRPEFWNSRSLDLPLNTTGIRPQLLLREITLPPSSPADSFRATGSCEGERKQLVSMLEQTRLTQRTWLQASPPSFALSKQPYGDICCVPQNSTVRRNNKLPY
mmetsp:Transcript_32618/g.77364  ORF Transcript_32618/g.77364 Transcript_32618/m.77364 type:complete len:309 (-) Transcript_32618:528-1454(-)